MLKILLCLLLFHAGILVAQHKSLITILPSSPLSAVEGESKMAECRASDPSNIEWISKDYTHIGSNPNQPVHTEDTGIGSLTLVFLNLTEGHNGTYMCKATFKNGISDIVKFELEVSRKYEFENHPKIYYSELGQGITLQCRFKHTDVKSHNFSWKFKELDIGLGVYKKDLSFKTFPDDTTVLLIKNVTEKAFGNYSCMSFVQKTGQVFQRDMELRLASAPEFKEVHKNNTVFVPVIQPPYLAKLTCRVTADPPATIKWFRYDKEIKPSEYDVSFEEKDNEKILKMNITTKDDLGYYVCKASNIVGSTNITLFLKEGELPKAPKFHVREPSERGYRLDIYQDEPKQNLTCFRVEYRKSKDDFEKWEHHDFKIQDSNTTPYCVCDNLTSNTEYVFKVGACTEEDLCTFTNEDTFTTSTAPKSTGDGSAACTLIQSLLTQFFVLLPLFLLS